MAILVLDHHGFRPLPSTTRVGVEYGFRPRPRVGPQPGQPWAMLHNPFGIGRNGLDNIVINRFTEQVQPFYFIAHRKNRSTFPFGLWLEVFAHF